MKPAYMIRLIAKKTSSLTSKQIKSICLLKDSCWKSGIKSQNIWFKKNIKNSDIHNMLIIDNELIGYTCLREKKFRHKINKKYFLFDTLILKKNFRKKLFRKKYLSFYLMKFNSKIIKRKKRVAYLICKPKLVFFYQKHNWLKIVKKKGLKKNRVAMIFNYKKKDIKIFQELIPQ